MDKKRDRFEDYFRTYSEMTFRSAYYIVRDYHTAQDICQEAFSRLSKRLNKVPLEEARVWLYRTATRLALDHLKKGGKYQTDVGLETSREHLIDIFSDPCYILEKKEEAEELRTILSKLMAVKPHWYQVILMSRLEKMSNQEISAELGVSPALVSQWKRRAEKWLIREYKKRDR